MKKLLADIGSSTIKVYSKDDNDLEKLFERTIDFKSDVKSEGKISEKNKKELFETFKSLAKQFPDAKIETYATSVFRELDRQEKAELIDGFFENTGIYFNIISHDLENFYLQKALAGKYKGKKPILLINIGGGSTELVILVGDEAIETHNINLGVGTILKEYSTINQQISKISLSKLVENIKKELPVLENRVDTAIYSGGELRYMQLANYKLEKNSIFRDKNHPKMISSKNFQSKNKIIFSDTKLEELEKLMPENPKWMHGARACSAIAQAIVEKYKVKSIIPSNSNLIDGVSRQKLLS